MTDVIRRYCGNCGRTGFHASDCNPPTMPITRVMPIFQPDQLPAEPTTGRAGTPRWSVVVTILGAVLMVLGICMNQPVSQLVWEATR